MVEIERLIFRFLWKGPDKIKRRTVCGDFSSGGIKMANVQNIVKSLKLSWISRFLCHENSPWKWYLQHRLDCVGGLEFLLQCNFDKRFITNLNISPFYKEVLNIWRNDIMMHQSCLSMDQIIWNNQNIKIENQPVYYESFLKVGVKFIHDLFIKESSRASFDYWVAKGLNKKNFMKWCGLRSAALTLYKAFRASLLSPTMTPKFIINTMKGNSYEFNAATNYKAKFFYNLLSQNDVELLPSYSSFLVESLNLQNVNELKDLYALTYKVTTNPKLRELQYRISTGIYNTNVILKRKKIIESALCEFCGKKDQDVYHLFFDCEIIQVFWASILDYYNQKMNSIYSLNKKDVILGNLSFPKILNFIILIGKLVIHLCHIKSENALP